MLVPSEVQHHKKIPKNFLLNEISLIVLAVLTASMYELKSANSWGQRFTLIRTLFY
jgi:hypothetical protein